MPKIIFGNKSFLEASLYTKEELEVLNFNDLIHPDIPKNAINETWEFIRKGKIWNGNTKFLKKILNKLIFQYFETF